MLHMSAVDLEQIEEGKEGKHAGAIVPVQSEKIGSARDTVLVPCADCDQFPEFYDHFCGVTGGRRHQSLSLNGGPLLLSPLSPIELARIDGEVLLRHIKRAAEMKGIRAVALCSHVPCGAAYGAQLDFFETMRLLVEGKLWLRKQLCMPELKILCFCHADFNSSGKQKKRTYAVDRKVMTTFLKAKGREVRL
jgi:hypothetical protein